jgi:hypothetical protein
MVPAFFVVVFFTAAVFLAAGVLTAVFRVAMKSPHHVIDHRCAQVYRIGAKAFGR